MGQDITVRARRGGSPRVRFFDCNRSLTGVAAERYESRDRAPRPRGQRPSDVLARRLLDLGAVRVTIASSVVTVEAPRDRWATLKPMVIEAIEHLFGYYGDDAGWSSDALGTAEDSP